MSGRTRKKAEQHGAEEFEGGVHASIFCTRCNKAYLPVLVMPEHDCVAGPPAIHRQAWAKGKGGKMALSRELLRRMRWGPPLTEEEAQGVAKLCGITVAAHADTLEGLRAFTEKYKPDAWEIEQEEREHGELEAEPEKAPEAPQPPATDQLDLFGNWRL